jgi:hypothetical protein
MLTRSWMAMTVGEPASLISRGCPGHLDRPTTLFASPTLITGTACGA